MDTYIVRKNKQLDISTLLGVGESQTHGDKGCQARFASWLLVWPARPKLSWRLITASLFTNGR